MSSIEYKSTTNLFKNTLKRVSIEVLFLVALYFFFQSEFSAKIPGWIEMTFMIILLAYILTGVLLYPKAKKTADTYKIILFDEYIGFSANGDVKTMPYSMFHISNVKRRKNTTKTITLSGTNSENIKLTNLDNMDDLLDQLIDRGVSYNSKSK